jgi:catechol 2,3-dioxygenase-like lactoylglutathione lyase family enzyme
MVQYKFSRCVCIETPDNEAAAKFYQDVLGMEFSTREGTSIELKAGDRLLYFDKGEKHQTVFEFVVADLDAARADLESHGCTPIRWEGKGKPCHMRDPFGNVFNLYQE